MNPKRDELQALLKRYTLVYIEHNLWALFPIER